MIRNSGGIASYADKKDIRGRLSGARPGMAPATAMLPEGNGITGAFTTAVNKSIVYDASGNLITSRQSFGYGNKAQWRNQDGSNSVTSIRNNTQLKAINAVYIVPGDKETLYSLIQAGMTLMVPVVASVQLKTRPSILEFVPFKVTSVSAPSLTGNFVNQDIDPGAVPLSTGGAYSGISGTPKLIGP